MTDQGGLPRGDNARVPREDPVPPAQLPPRHAGRPLRPATHRQGPSQRCADDGGPRHAGRPRLACLAEHLEQVLPGMVRRPMRCRWRGGRGDAAFLGCAALWRRPVAAPASTIAPAGLRESARGVLPRAPPLGACPRALWIAAAEGSSLRGERRWERGPGESAAPRAGPSPISILISARRNRSGAGAAPWLVRGPGAAGPDEDSDASGPSGPVVCLRARSRIDPHRALDLDSIRVRH
jgi:hypothetical protein